MQPETNTTLTTPEPETPQADPVPAGARESTVDAAPIQKPAPEKRLARIAELRADRRIQDKIAARRAVHLDAFTPAPRFAFGAANRIGRTDGGMAWFEPFVSHPTFSETIRGWEIAKIFPGGDVEIYGHRAYSQGRGKPTVSAAYRTQRLAKVDKATLLRQNAELRAGMDALAEQVTALDCERIQLQIAAAKAPTVSTIVTPPTDAAPEPPALLSEITSQVAEAVMHSERAQAIPVTEEWYDVHTLAYVRIGFPRLTPDRQEEIAPRLMKEICQPPNQRNSAWPTIVREVQAASEKAGGAS